MDWARSSRVRKRKTELTLAKTKSGSSAPTFRFRHPPLLESAVVENDFQANSQKSNEAKHPENAAMVGKLELPDFDYKTVRFGSSSDVLFRFHRWLNLQLATSLSSPIRSLVGLDPLIDIHPSKQTPFFPRPCVSSTSFPKTAKMSDFASKIKILRTGQKPQFPSNANTLEYAQSLDAQDELRHFRDEFIIPTRASLKKKALDGSIPGTCPSAPQPRFSPQPHS